VPRGAVLRFRGNFVPHQAVRCETPTRADTVTPRVTTRFALHWGSDACSPHIGLHTDRNAGFAQPY
jgi:hypothetical protein